MLLPPDCGLGLTGCLSAGVIADQSLQSGWAPQTTALKIQGCGSALDVYALAAIFELSRLKVRACYVLWGSTVWLGTSAALCRHGFGSAKL